MTIKPESADIDPHKAKGFFEKLIAFAIDQRWLVMLISLAVAILGVISYQHLPIDAVPDITNVQVQINTGAPGYSPRQSANVDS